MDPVAAGIYFASLSIRGMVLTFLQQLVFPQQFEKMELALAFDGDGDGGFEVDGSLNLLGAPLDPNGRSISTNSRS